jgi:hypothetical protein
LDTTAALPESPIFCPNVDFLTIRSSKNCSNLTYSILCDMRNLTMMLLEQEAAPGEAHTAAHDDTHIALDYCAMVNAVKERVIALPSAHVPGLPISNDWIYEACRITALIYTAAILWRVPFSTAAGPSHTTMLCEPAQTGTPPRLVQALYETLERSDVSEVWNDMAGVLYWISTVGAAAARPPAAITDKAPHLQTPEEAYVVWTQRCLTMYSVRTMIVLIFQHPTAVIHSQKTLLKVQRLIGGPASMYHPSQQLVHVPTNLSAISGYRP